MIEPRAAARDIATALRRYIHPACKKLGIEIGGWHDFRHTLTTKMRKLHVHPRVIADILGHSKVNLSMDVYDRADADDIAAALLPSVDCVTLGNIRSSVTTNSPLIPNGLVSAEGIEPSTY